MVTAIFKNEERCTYAHGLWQWDFGQVLRIQGLRLPTAVEIHFSLQPVGGESESRIGITKDCVTDVVIPDTMLENEGIIQNYEIYAFIYLTDENSGQTEYKITMNVKARPKPKPYDTPEEAELFREAIATVNDAAERAETAEQGSVNAKEQAQEIADDIRFDVSSMVLEANVAKNTAVENANITVNNAEETEADKQETANSKNVARAYRDEAVRAAGEAEEVLNTFLATLSGQPKRYYKLSIEEMQAIPNPNPDDLCYVIDLQKGQSQIYLYDSKDIDGDTVNPEWQFLGNAEFANMDRVTLLRILELSAVAVTGDYKDLTNIPARYNSPFILDSSGGTVTWDYSQSDMAVVTLTEPKQLNIIGGYNGAVAVVQCYGSTLAFNDAAYNKSVTLGYLEPLKAEHITYTLIYNAGKWDVTALVYAGGEADA